MHSIEVLFIILLRIIVGKWLNIEELLAVFFDFVEILLSNKGSLIATKLKILGYNDDPNNTNIWVIIVM